MTGRSYCPAGMSRALLVLGLSWAVTACDPVVTSGLTIVPRPAISPESTQALALRLAADVAAQHGLAASAPDAEGGPPDEPWDCFWRETFSLCTKRTGQDVQVRFRQALRFQFKPWADSARADLTERLRAQFGIERVRDCVWRLAEDPRRSTRWTAAVRTICLPDEAARDSPEPASDEPSEKEMAAT